MTWRSAADNAAFTDTTAMLSGGGLTMVILWMVLVDATP